MTVLQETRGTVKSAPSPPSSQRLEAALAGVPGGDLHDSLDQLTRALPVPLGVEIADIRLLASDGDRELHLVAAVGSSPRETVQRAIQTHPISVFRGLFALGREHSLARSLGLQWVAGRWLYDESEPIGVVATATRTERRPTKDQEELLTGVGAELGRGLSAVDRSTEALKKLSGLLAYAAAEEGATMPNQALDALRPRERDILVLYAEGLAAEEIGRVLFISPHTVRTHIKNAFRRLGVHSREEAANVVHKDGVARIT